MWGHCGLTANLKATAATAVMTRMCAEADIEGTRAPERASTPDVGDACSLQVSSTQHKETSPGRRRGREGSEQSASPFRLLESKRLAWLAREARSFPWSQASKGRGSSGCTGVPMATRSRYIGARERLEKGSRYSRCPPLGLSLGQRCGWKGGGEQSFS